MKTLKCFFLSAIVLFVFNSGCQNSNSSDMNDEKSKQVLFLHHSTGKIIWQGGNNIVTKVKGKLGMKGAVEKWFDKYNRSNNTNYQIREMAFPKKQPYGWKNYPFDYYNIWVKHGDEESFMEEPTLKTLAPQYDLIVFKHCFPASRIVFDGTSDIDSERKMVENYKMQYIALKKELHKYPDTRFLLWTPPALTRAKSSPEAARAATGFSEWVVNEWDQSGDNVFIWDFRTLETGGGDYILPENSVDERDSHPSHALAKKVYPLFGQRMVDVLELEK